LNKTSIEWCDYSSNPIRARLKDDPKKRGWHCERTSSGCLHCYAEAINRRFGTGLPFTPASVGQVEVYLDEREFAAWAKLKEPQKIFVCDMTDLFGTFVPDEMIERVFAAMEACPQHTFLVLTKRAVRMRGFVSGRNLLPNVWLGVSVENQRAADLRIPELLEAPAAVRFLSCEPLLGPVDLALFGTLPKRQRYTLTYEELHWVITGAESGAGARMADPDWFRSLRDQCVMAGVPFFLKQFADHGKKIPLPMLDGQVWAQMPEVSR
jgi:protein gp37